MLDSAHGVDTPVTELPCSVKFPAELTFQHGVSPSFPGCKRQFPRFRSGSPPRMAMYLNSSLPTLVRESRWVAVYLVDFGRGGMGIIHGEPLYPRERLTVILVDGREQVIEVVRCKRLAESCFIIGARLVAKKAGV